MDIIDHSARISHTEYNQFTRDACEMISIRWQLHADQMWQTCESENRVYFAAVSWRPPVQAVQTVGVSLQLSLYGGWQMEL